MKLLRRPTRHTRLQLVLLTVLSLLFQQVALAAHACTIVNAPVSSMTMSAHCDGMPMAHSEQAPSLCAAHCTSPALVAQDAHSPTPPPLLALALIPVLLVLTLPPEPPATYAHTVVRQLPGTPPALRFRVLLI